MAEIYIGTKFSAVQLSKQTPDHPELNSLKFWCSFFDTSNLAPPYPGGSSGNLSFKINSENNFIITASNTKLSDDMNESSFSQVSECNLENFSLKYKGEKIPSSESLMHFAIYKSRPEIFCIMHGHSDEILTYAEKLNLPQTKTEYPYGTVELINEVIPIAEKSNFLVIKNHGFIALGKNIEDAGQKIINILNKISVI